MSGGIFLRAERGKMRNSYPDRNYNFNNKRVRPLHHKKEKHAGVSLAFCWGFGFVVCLTFGLALFLMSSAGHFSFSPSTGVEAAWGDNDVAENFVAKGLKVEVTDLDLPKSIPQNNEELYAQTKGLIVEDFGPFPKYLSDYESIKLTVDEDGTKLPEEDEEDLDLISIPLEVSTPEIKTKNDNDSVTLTENGIKWREHIVKNGETLSDIAAAHGNITANDILVANGLKDANKLSENQLLLIPNDASTIEDTLDEVRTRQMRVAATKEKLEPIKTRSYVVAQGDSLWSISNSQNIELDTLVGSNVLKTSARLRPGAILRIPNQDGIFYTLKKGEAIENVSKRYGVSMNKIKQVNVDVDVASLKTGDEIFLPGAKPEGLIEHEPVKVAEVKELKKSAPVSKNNNSKTVAKTEKNEKSVKLPKGEVAVKSSGGFRWPIMGRINSPFGWRQHPITRRRDFHTGIDIKANRGDPIKAAGSGRIVYSGWMGGYGKVLVIEHSNGQSTLYAHCSSLLVGKGENVSSGKLIAKVGTTGRSTGPHLHFEVRNGNSPVNPIKYLSR